LPRQAVESISGGGAAVSKLNSAQFNLCFDRFNDVTTSTNHDTDWQMSNAHLSLPAATRESRRPAAIHQPGTLWMH
jgi:hypothetical protein